MIVKSMRGVDINMGKLLAENGHVVALGNAKMNARGDRISSNGNVEILREDIARDYHRSASKTVKQASLRNIQNEVLTFESPAEAVKALTKSKRKLVEND